MLGYVLYWKYEFSRRLRNMINEIKLYNKCRCCGEYIEEWLWCDKCRELVDQELNWEISRPFEFYFRFYKKQNEKFRNSTGIWKIPVR